jgi:hypothetical protein
MFFRLLQHADGDGTDAKQLRCCDWPRDMMVVDGSVNVAAAISGCCCHDHGDDDDDVLLPVGDMLLAKMQKKSMMIREEMMWHEDLVVKIGPFLLSCGASSLIVVDCCPPDAFLDLRESSWSGSKAFPMLPIKAQLTYSDRNAVLLSKRLWDPAAQQDDWSSGLSCMCLSPNISVLSEEKICVCRSIAS